MPVAAPRSPVKTALQADRSPGAVRKQATRLARRPDMTGPRQYKDKSENGQADHREGSPRRGPLFSDPVGKGPAAPRHAGKSSEAGKVPSRARWSLGIRLPKHVLQCFDRGGRSWWIWNWRHDTPAVKTRRPYKCGSWRCDSCCRHEASVCFARIREAVSRPELDARGWCVFVLTLDRDGFFSGKPWGTADEAYKALGKLCTSFLEKLRYRQKKLGMRVTKNEWCGVVEAHRSGWPHLNLMVYAPELADELEDGAPSKPSDHSERCRCPECRDAALLRGDLLDLATSAGWGRQSTGERVRSLESLAGYIVKLAGMAEESMGRFTHEIAKITQRPLTAPERFRRLRSGKGFLPPRRKNPDVTGTLVRRQRELDGTVTAIPLHKVPGETVPHVLACCYAEEDIAHAELARRTRVFVGPAPPLLRTFFLPGAGSTFGSPSYDGSEVTPCPTTVNQSKGSESSSLQSQSLSVVSPTLWSQPSLFASRSRVSEKSSIASTPLSNPSTVDSTVSVTSPKEPDP